MFESNIWLRNLSKCPTTDTCKLSGRISESVPVRRTRNCDARIRSWRTTEPRPAICTYYALTFYFLSYLLGSKPYSFLKQAENSMSLRDIISLMSLLSELFFEFNFPAI